MLLEQSQVQEEEVLLWKVSDLWSLKVPIVTLKETQLSNPQKYQFDFFFFLPWEEKEGS